MASRLDDISLNTLIGLGSVIQGNIKINGFVRIDGDIDGNIETDGNVIIGEKARIRGNITAKSVTIGGVVLGNIKADEYVKLLSSSAIIGDIISHKVQIDDMAYYKGHCISIKDDQTYSELSQNYLQERAIKEKALH